MREKFTPYRFWLNCLNCPYEKTLDNSPITADTLTITHSLRRLHKVELHRMNLETLTSEILKTVTPSDAGRDRKLPNF